MSPPSSISFPLPTPSHPTRLSGAAVWAPWGMQQIATIYFTYGSVYVSMLSLEVGLWILETGPISRECREVSSGPGEVCRHDSISFTNIKQMFNKVCYHRYLPGWHNGKEHAYQCRRHKRRVFDPWVGKIPWTKKWQPTPVFLPGDSHGQRSLMGYSPWGCKRAGHDWSHFIHMHTCFHNPFFFFQTPIILGYKSTISSLSLIA